MQVWFVGNDNYNKHHNDDNTITSLDNNKPMSTGVLTKTKVWFINILNGQSAVRMYRAQI